MCRHDDDPETIATTSGRAIARRRGARRRHDRRRGAAGEPGEIIVRGYNIMLGYLDDPDETAKTIDAKGWLHTGDIGIMDERGYVRITDRMKDMFIVGGFNAYPAEIENLMPRTPPSPQVAVVGMPDERMGEVGWRSSCPHRASATPRTIAAWCRERDGELQGAPPSVRRRVAAQRLGQGAKYKLRKSWRIPTAE